MRRTMMAALTCTVVLTGCSATTSVSGPMHAMAPDPDKPGTAQSAGTAQAQQPSTATALAPADASRQIVRTVNLALTTKNVDNTVKAAHDVGTKAGGYASDENSGGDHASLTLKVPTDRLSAVLDQLAALGTVTTRTEHAEDVTEQVIDVDSRLATQRASVDRVRALVDKATSIADITSVESELSKREADLESLQQRHDALAGQVALSTVSMDINRSAVPPAPDTSSTFLSGFGAGWAALVASLGTLSVAVGALLPFAVLVGIPAWLVFWLVRRRRKARPVVVEVTQGE